MTKKLAARLLAFSLAVGGAGMFGVQGCAGKAGSLCDIYCDCELCNDVAEDLCLIQVNEFLDRAAAYDCASEGDDYVTCATERFDCNQNNFQIEPDCADEREDWFDCIADNSAIIDNVTTGNNAAQGNPDVGAGPPQGQD